MQKKLHIRVPRPDGTFDATDPAPPASRVFYQVQAK